MREKWSLSLPTLRLDFVNFMHALQNLHFSWHIWHHAWNMAQIRFQALLAQISPIYHLLPPSFFISFIHSFIHSSIQQFPTYSIPRYRWPCFSLLCPAWHYTFPSQSICHFELRFSKHNRKFSRFLVSFLISLLKPRGYDSEGLEETIAWKEKLMFSEIFIFWIKTKFLLLSIYFFCIPMLIFRKVNLSFWVNRSNLRIWLNEGLVVFIFCLVLQEKL